MKQEAGKKTVLQILDDIISKIVLGLAVTAAVFTFTIALCICYSVIGRALLKQDVAWALELCEYLIYIDVMLATPWVLKIDKHVRVDILYYLIPPKAERILNQIINVLGVIMCAWFCYYSIITTVAAFNSGINLVRVVPVKKWLVMIFLPFMSALCTIIFIRRFIVLWKHKDIVTSQDYFAFEEARMNPKYSTTQTTELVLPDYDVLKAEAGLDNQEDASAKITGDSMASHSPATTNNHNKKMEVF